MSNPKVEAKKQDIYQDQEWGEVKSSMIRLYMEPEKMNIVNDQLLIQRQNDLMEQIKEKIHRSRYKENFGSMEILPIDSSLSGISSAYNYADDQSLIKSKFTEQFESSLVNSALKEVRANCTEEAYETIRNYVINNKQKQCENLTKALQKKSKQIEELSLSFILKQNELTKLKEQMSPYITKVQYFEQEKKKWKKKNDQITEKEKRIHKAEMALIFKEKMHQQAKKRSERLKQFMDSIHSKMRIIEKDLNKIWNSIMSSMEKQDTVKCCEEMDPKGCWKKQVMKKCREKLLEQRNLLKDEEKQLEKQYEILQGVSQQCKKLVSDSQEGLTSQISNGGTSSITMTPKQDKNFKINSMSLIQPDCKKNGV